MKAKDTTREVLTMDEAAVLMRVCSRTLRRWIQAGKIPARKIGRRWRLHRPALIALLNSAGEAP